MAPMPYNINPETGQAESSVTPSRMGFHSSFYPDRTTWASQVESDAQGGRRRHSPLHIPSSTVGLRLGIAGPSRLGTYKPWGVGPPNPSGGGQPPSGGGGGGNQPPSG